MDGVKGIMLWDKRERDKYHLTYDFTYRWNPKTNKTNSENKIRFVVTEIRVKWEEWVKWMKVVKSY